MDIPKLSDLSDEDLKRNKKTLTISTGMLTGALLVLFTVNIMSTMKKGFTALNVVPIALLPILIVNFNTLSGIKKEIKARGLS